MPLIVGFPSGGSGSGSLETPLPKLMCTVLIEYGEDIPVSESLSTVISDLTFTAVVSAQ